MKPNARRSYIIVQEVGTDTLVYDQLRDTAHSLSQVTGYVFRKADGTRTIAELSVELERDLGMEGGEALVSAALWELQRVHLLDDAFVVEPASGKDVSRREAMRRFGIAALALVAITTIAAPTPAMAKSFGGIRPGKRPPRATTRPRVSATQVVNRIKDALSRLLGKFGR